MDNLKPGGNFLVFRQVYFAVDCEIRLRTMRLVIRHDDENATVPPRHGRRRRRHGWALPLGCGRCAPVWRLRAAPWRRKLETCTQS